MLKGHPKGLYVAFFANMGERFGFYTMMAILVLFLQAKYGLAAELAGDIYSWFYFAIYALALVGGFVADATKKYTAIISMVIKVDFDLTMSILASNLYRLLALQRERYEHLSVQSLYDKFVLNGADIIIQEDAITVQLKKKRNLPLLLEAMQSFSRHNTPGLMVRMLFLKEQPTRS